MLSQVNRIREIQLGKKEENKLHGRDLDAILGKETIYKE